MSYKKRDWDTTGNEVTKEDFKRIENGVETNDKTIAEQGKQINVLSGKNIYKGKINDLVAAGDYYLGSGTSDEGLPEKANGYVSVRESSSGAYLTQRFKAVVTGKIYERIKSANVWQPWQQIATTTNVGITFQNGWNKKYGDCNPTLYKVGNAMVLTAVVSNPSPIPSGGIILSLPTEAIPNSNLVFKAFVENTPVIVKVLLNGTIIIYFNYTANQALFLNLSWVRA